MTPWRSGNVIPEASEHPDRRATPQEITLMLMQHDMQASENVRVRVARPQTVSSREPKRPDRPNTPPPETHKTAK